MEYRLLHRFFKHAALCFVFHFFGILLINAQIPGWNQYHGPSAKLAAINDYGNTCLKNQKFEEASRVFKAGFTIARQASLDSLAIANLYLLGKSYRYRSMYDSAFYYLRKGDEMMQGREFIKLRTDILLELFAIYNRMGKEDSAHYVLNNLLGLRKKLDSVCTEQGIIEMYSGHLAKHQADYKSSLQHYHKALDIFNRLNDSLNMGNIYISIANVLVYYGNKNEALNYHKQAAAILSRMGRKFELANELLNITDMYYTGNHLDSAERSVRQALRIANDLKEKTYVAIAFYHLGKIYSLRKQYTAAEKYFLQSLQLSLPSKMVAWILKAYQGLGELYSASGKPQQAKVYLDKFMDIVHQNGNQEETLEGYFELAENAFALHDYENAFAYEKKFATLKDSIYTASVSKNIAEMESRYQSQRKEQEIALLRKDRQLQEKELQKQRTFKWASFIFIGLLALIGFLIINRYRVKQKNKQLLAVEKLRNRIARDLHDDIGSTLSSINILSKVALQQSQPGEVTKTNLQKIKDRSSATMESMGDIVWAINPQNDDVETMVLRMKTFTAEILEPLNIKYLFANGDDFRNVKLNVEIRKDMYLIFKEALNNAAKYSQCNQIKIELKKEGQWIKLTVTDDGRGFDMMQSNNGNGLRNMQERAGVMKAQLKLHTAPGNGTSIYLDVPIT